MKKLMLIGLLWLPAGDMGLALCIDQCWQQLEGCRRTCNKAENSGNVKQCRAVCQDVCNKCTGECER